MAFLGRGPQKGHPHRPQARNLSQAPAGGMFPALPQQGSPRLPSQATYMVQLVIEQFRPQPRRLLGQSAQSVS
jgi:hypothetical protein